MFLEKYIKETVDNLIKKHGTSNPHEIINSMTNLSFKYEQLSDTLNGYYLYISQENQIIRVHDNLGEYHDQYVVFHELGHCILNHSGSILLDYANIISTSKEEHEANLFAAYFFKLHHGIFKHNIDNFTFPSAVKSLICKFID